MTEYIRELDSRGKPYLRRNWRTYWMVLGRIKPNTVLESVLACYIPDCDMDTSRAKCLLLQHNSSEQVSIATPVDYYAFDGWWTEGN